ncbi:MAG: carboxymuconolactone decarboxylase family protein, partial [Vulcanimicrobiota bacterium]
PFYTDRERAALEWAEAVTLVSANNVDDELYARVRTQFDEKELVDLTLAITAINSWNRLAISFRSEVGSYEPG